MGSLQLINIEDIQKKENQKKMIIIILIVFATVYVYPICEKYMNFLI